MCFLTWQRLCPSLRPFLYPFRWLCLCPLLWLCWSATANSNPDHTLQTLIIHTSADWRYINQGVEVLEDPHQQLTIDEVAAAAMADRFQPISGPNLNFGFSTSAYWLRLRVMNQDPITERLYLKHEFPSIDYLTLYQLRQDQWHVQRAGDRVAISERYQPFYAPVFEIPAPTGQVRTLYLRIEGEGILKMPLLLLGQQAYDHNLRQTTMFLGLYFGAMGMIILYNLGVYLFTRHHLHLFYSAFMITQTLLIACWSGIANFLFYPEHPLFARYALLGSIGLLLMMLALYLRHVLETRRYHPLADRLLDVLMLIGVVQVLLIAFNIQPLAGIYSFPATLIGQLIMVFAALSSIRRAPILGLIVLAGWMVTMLGVTAAGLTATRRLESSWLTENLFNVGWVLEAFLFSIALAQHTSQMSREKDRIERQQQRSQEESNAKRLLLEEVSHDLRTPLHGIHGSAQLLAHTRLDPQQQGYCEQIHTSVQNIIAVLDNSLAFSRRPSAHFEPRLETCDPGQLAQQLMLLAQPLPRQPGVRLDLQQPVGPLPQQISIDRHRIEQISLNLLNNALKFTTAGYVCLRLHWHSNELVIEVEDSGPGIAAAQLETIFEPYQRLDTRQPGHGLGLAISRQNAEQLGGSLTVVSRQGHGSCFTLTVPAPIADAVPHSQTPHNSMPTAAVLPPLPAGNRILVVDDVALNREIARDLLQLEQQQVDVAADAGATRITLQRSLPDLVLMDVRLGNDNGVQLAHQLRQEGLLPDSVPVIMMSAAVDLYFPDNQLPNGIQGLLPKPVNRERLRNGLQPWLQQRYPLRREMLQLLGAGHIQRMVEDLEPNLEQQQQQLRQARQQQDMQQLDRIRHRLEGLAQQLELHPLLEWLQAQPRGQWFTETQLEQASQQALHDVRQWLALQ